MSLSHKLRLGVILFILAWTVGCDQTTKQIAREELEGRHSIIFFAHGFGEFRFAQNPGAFLSFGEALPQSLRPTIFTIVAGIGLFGLLAYLMLGRRINWPSFAGLGLVWAGGMSNLVDRVMRHGLVSDFIFIHIGPLHTGIFNVADVVIMTGAAVIACDIWLRRRHPVHKQSTEDNRNEVSK